MVNDPIGDFITRLKNASMVGKRSVTLPFSAMKHSIALALKKAGYLGEITETGDGAKKSMTVGLLYDASGSPRIHDVRRISKPGRRLYAPVSKIYPVKYGKGLLVVTTPRGILTDAECRKNRVGGETLFSIW
jgi:small subunit ribosomal protein S8